MTSFACHYILKTLQVISKCKGSQLVGRTYKPLFPYFQHLKGPPGGGAKTGAFRVVSDKYVTDSDGTGVVHQAPFFGEDDLRVCLAHGAFPTFTPVKAGQGAFVSVVQIW